MLYLHISVLPKIAGGSADDDDVALANLQIKKEPLTEKEIIDKRWADMMSDPNPTIRMLLGIVTDLDLAHTASQGQKYVEELQKDTMCPQQIEIDR